MFYPDIKKHISPSALDAWFNNKSLFIKSYFLNEKTPETAAMRAGKQIHALAEAGVIDVRCKYDHCEKTLEAFIGDKKVLGIPDSFGECQFVDYKTGKDNNWNNDRLATDLKMKTTAWLVWNYYNKKLPVVGKIEYIPTCWNEKTREIEPTGESTQVVATRLYPIVEMEEFSAIISKTMDEINAEYEKFLRGTDEFVNQADVAEYARLHTEVEKFEKQMTEIKDRIAGQMAFGGVRMAKTEVGTFYFKERKTYDYPPSLKINYLDMGLTLEDVGAITTAGKIVKEQFEQTAEPKSINRILEFRKAK